ncbi:Hypothetical protein FKW44_016915 [Caligus rogercresseyi]|uniref:Uncharacterized protein n=1 Tax=Caligus rogercresseyi TaxID=217165 RepID=A0A7T8H2N0_CALRO|nr:Hypothetical protein FKW44_016915 [Caligus rogercresseyi]
MKRYYRTPSSGGANKKRTEDFLVKVMEAVKRGPTKSIRRLAWTMDVGTCTMSRL